MPYAVIGLDSSGFVTYWNRAAESTLGWTVDEAGHRPLLSVVFGRGWDERLFAPEAMYESLHTVLTIRDGSPLFVVLTKRATGFGSIVTILEASKVDHALRLIESLPVCTYTTSLRSPSLVGGELISVSSHLEELGWPTELTDASSVLHEDDRDRVLEEIAAWSAPQPWQIEYRVRLDNGTLWLHEAGSVVLDERGKPSFVQGYVVDITAKRALEHRLAPSEVRYRELLESLPLVALSVYPDRAKETNYMTPYLTKRFGITLEEWTFQMKDQIYGPDLEKFESGFWEWWKSRSEKEFELDFRVLDASGEPVWVNQHAVLKRDKFGEYFVDGYIADIDARKRAEEQAQRDAERLRALVETQQRIATSELDLQSVMALAAEQILALVDADGVCIEVAARGLLAYSGTLFGADPLTLEGLSLQLNGSEALLCEDIEDDESSIADLCRALGARSYVNIPVLRDQHAIGHLTAVAERTGTFTESDVRTLHLFAGLLGAANARLAELEAKEEQLEHLQELDRLKDEFVALVSHELRTPLTSIRGYLDLLLDSELGPLNEQQAHFVEVVQRNSERLLRLVGDLLFVAQIESGMLMLELDSIDLARVVSEAIQVGKSVARAGGISLEGEIEQPLPIRGDRARLGQLLDNLISNGLKFTPPGGSVRVRAFRDDHSVTIEVADSGIGIPAGEIDQLFQRFFRSSNATESAIQGTGLGLSISKAIVEGHGGTITASSSEGVGTTFTVRLTGQA